MQAVGHASQYGIEIQHAAARGFKGAGVVLAGNRVVELHQVDRVPPQPPQASLDRARNGGLGIVEVGGPEPYLRSHYHTVPGIQVTQDTPQVFLRPTVAVARCGVEVRDARLERPGDGPSLLVAIAADEQSPDRTGPKAEGRHLQPRPAEFPVVHQSSPPADPARVTVIPPEAHGYTGFGRLRGRRASTEAHAGRFAKSSDPPGRASRPRARPSNRAPPWPGT